MSKVYQHDDIAIAVGDIPSGLFVVSVQTASGAIEGYLASWVQQVSFTPLRISVAMKKERKGYSDIVSGNTFTLSTVANGKKDLMGPFWSGYPDDKNPYSKLSHEISKNGGVILKDAKSVMECKVVEVLNPGDHSIIIADVIASYVTRENDEVFVHLRDTGADY